MVERRWLRWNKRTRWAEERCVQERGSFRFCNTNDAIQVWLSRVHLRLSLSRGFNRFNGTFPTSFPSLYFYSFFPFERAYAQWLIHAYLRVNDFILHAVLAAWNRIRLRRKFSSCKPAYYRSYVFRTWFTNIPRYVNGPCDPFYRIEAKYACLRPLGYFQNVARCNFKVSKMLKYRIDIIEYTGWSNRDISEKKLYFHKFAYFMDEVEFRSIYFLRVCRTIRSWYPVLLSLVLFFSFV